MRRGHVVLDATTELHRPADQNPRTTGLGRRGFFMEWHMLSRSDRDRLRNAQQNATERAQEYRSLVLRRVYMRLCVLCGDDMGEETVAFCAKCQHQIEAFGRIRR